LQGRKGPVIVSTDYIRAYSEQIREFVASRFVSLGTDGFGRSDTRENLRIFFEVNRYYIVVAALKALSDDGEIDSKVVQQAIGKYGIDPEKPNPVTV
jgi:pyruvate dehydrogenase E1 component